MTWIIYLEPLQFTLRYTFLLLLDQYLSFLHLITQNVPIYSFSSIFYTGIYHEENSNTMIYDDDDNNNNNNNNT